MSIEFVVGDPRGCSDARLVYRDDEHAFDLEGDRPSGVTSLVLNDLQLEIDGEGTVLFAWGYCPRASWKQTDASPPSFTPGSLIAQVGAEIVPGVSKKISGEDPWPVYENAASGWICVGDPDSVGDREGGVEFAPNCIAVLRDHRLVALWLRPEKSHCHHRSRALEAISKVSSRILKR